MIIQTIAKIIFYGLTGILALYSAVMIFILLRFGQSKILGLMLSGLYILLIVTLYASTVSNFLRIEFPNFEL